MHGEPREIKQPQWNVDLIAWIAALAKIKQLWSHSGVKSIVQQRLLLKITPVMSLAF